MALADELLRQRQRPYWVVSIQGLRKRYGTLPAGVDAVFDAWNPADAGFNQHIEPWLQVPDYGREEADPLNGRSQIPSHRFVLRDGDDEITALLAVADTPKALTLLCDSINDSQTTIPILDYSDFPSSGELFIERETITYTGKSTDTTTRFANTHAGFTADAGDTVSFPDATLAQPVDYWAGAIITFTGGLNNGQSREVRRWTCNDPITAENPFQMSESSRTFYFDPDNPLPNNVALGDPYTITYPKHKIYDPGISGADDYWNGAMLVVLADAGAPENVGFVTYVRDFDGTNDIITLYEQLPAHATATTQFKLLKYWFTGCMRGAYGSDASAHSITDKQNDLIPIEVSDKPRYIKGRRVWFYDYRRGLSEGDCHTHVATIDDYGLNSDGRSYWFSATGILSLLGRRLMNKPKRGRVDFLNVWGGHWYLCIPQVPVDSEHRVQPFPVMSDGSLDYSATEIYHICEDAAFPTSGNIKIGNEIIHYIDNIYFVPPNVPWMEARRWFKLGEFFNVSNMTWDDIRASRFDPDILIMAHRGIFAEKIGKKDLIGQWTNLPDADKINQHFRDNPPAVSGLIEEHSIGDEIVEACVCCDDPEISDFPRYDRIEYQGAVAALPSFPFTITGAISGSTATVIDKYDGDLASQGTLVVINADGSFYGTPDGTHESISSGAWSANVYYHILGDGKELPARNNPLSVFLQLLCSKKGDQANGLYDTLPEGWGLGIDQTLVDIDGIEALRDERFPQTKIDFIIHDSISLKEWAEDNLFRFLQIWPYENNDGEISLAYLYTETEAQDLDEASALIEIDDSEVSARMLPDWTSGQKPVVKLIVRYNKHPGRDEWYGELEVNLGHAKDYYEDTGQTVRIDCGVLYIPDLNALRKNAKDPDLPELVGRLINPMWSRHSKHPCPVIGMDTRFRNVRLQIGQAIKLTNDNLPNMRTGQRGFSGEYMQIMGRRPNNSGGFVGLTVWHIGVHDKKYGRKPPSARIVSIAANVPIAGQSRVTIYKNEFCKVDEVDRDFFVVGDKVAFLSDTYDPLGGAANPEQANVIALGSGTTYTIDIDTVLANPPSDGDLLEVADYDNATATRQSTRVFLADEDRVLGTADNTAFKYK